MGSGMGPRGPTGSPGAPHGGDDSSHNLSCTPLHAVIASRPHPTCRKQPSVRPSFKRWSWLLHGNKPFNAMQSLMINMPSVINLYSFLSL